MTSQQPLTAALLLLSALYAAQAAPTPTPVPLSIPTPVSLPHLGVPFGPSDKSLVRCVAYDEFVSNAVMTYAVSYLGDNTAENAQPISAKDLRPFTPAQLFDQLYQGEASSINFKKTLIALKYAGACEPKEVWADREQLRRNVYTYAKAESYAIARSSFGELMLLVASDFVPAADSPDWIRFRCMPRNSVDLAQIAISIELSRLRNEIGEIRFGSFLDLTSGTTLAFAIDDTGSMSGEIKAAKQRVELITDQLKNSINRPHEYVLVPFNDPFIYDITHTRDSEEFKQALRRLYAHGGGDAPEMCLTGIKWAIQKSRPGSTIYVITDNDAKDYKLQNLVVAQAQHKQIAIVFLLTDELKVCGMSFYYHGDQLICRKLYEYIAEKTGGKVLVVRKDQIFRATEVIKTGLVQGLVPIRRETLFASKNDPYGFPFAVDPSIKELVIEASGACGSLQFQNHLQKHTPIEKYGQTLSTSFLVKGGQYGQWRISGANSTSKISCETEVSARTSFGFVVTTFVKKLNNQNDCYKILNGQPTNQDAVAFYLDFYGEQNLNARTSGDRISKIRFVNELGDDVMPPHMIRHHHGDVTEKIHFESGLPAGLDPFYLVAEGRLGGIRFSRYSTYKFTTTSMEISTNIADVTIRPGLESEFTCSVTNRGDKKIKVAFDVSAKTGTILYEEDFTPTILVGKTREIPIKIKLDSKVQVGTSIKITISTKDVDSEASQYHVIEAIVGQNERPKMESLTIHTIITTRFAETKVTMKVRNDKRVAREAEVEIMLPGEAFIMNLTMLVGDDVMIGSVEEKRKAKRIYNKAKSLNFGAGHVAVRDKSSQVYKTKLLVPPFQTATFELSYQQLLRRENGLYEYMVFIDPKQPVRDLRVDVHIQEESVLNFVRVPGYESKRTYRNIRNVNKILNKYPSASPDMTYSEDRRKCHVFYAPTLSAQAAHSPLGLSGIFTVQFDVERRQVFGESFVSDGFFTHFFSAPAYVVAPPKMVTFIIDTSSSMLGHKLKQVKLALKQTLKSFDSQDYVNLVLMNDDPRPVFDDVMMQATPGNLRRAMEIVEELEAEGGTNFEIAFDVAFENLMPYMSFSDNSVSMDDPGAGADIAAPVEGTYDRHAKMIVFLTDGKPTVGQTNTNEILQNINLMNVERVNVHAIGFGNLPDMGFLDKLALENGGMAKRIFEDLDAASQIKNFFGDVIRPLMSDVNVEFEKGKVHDVTMQHFDNIYDGKEIVVSGRFTNKNSKSTIVKTKVTGKTATDYIEFDFEIDQSKAPKHLLMSTHKLELFSENMWAYLQIKDLLDQSVVVDDPDIKKEIEEAALTLSLAHNFVTPLTSMVVTRDEDRATIDRELLIEDMEADVAEEEEVFEVEEPAMELDDVFSRTLGIDHTSSLPGSEELYGMYGKVDDSDVYATATMSMPITTTTFGFHADRLRGDGGFDGGWLYGDPHFVIPIQDDFNLCFTWDGQGDEVYNILYDSDRDISINAVMTTAHENDFDRNGSFVSAISFVLKRKNFVMIVHPNNITLERYDLTRKSVTFPVYYDFTEFIGNGVVLRVTDVHPSSANVKITIDQMDFQVVLRRDWKHYTTHLDFSIGRDVAQLTDSHYDGLIGQFVNADIKIDEPQIVDETEQSHVVINGRSGTVRKWHARNPAISMKTIVPCWTSEAQELTHFTHENYLVDTLLATPKYPNAL